MTVPKTIEQVKGEIQQDIESLSASFAKHREGGSAHRGRRLYL
jgi:hypothetical protein